MVQSSYGGEGSRFQLLLVAPEAYLRGCIYSDTSSRGIGGLEVHEHHGHVAHVRPSLRVENYSASRDKRGLKGTQEVLRGWF